MTGRSRWPAPLSLIVFVTGLALAVIAGVSTYQAFGLYGGPVRTGIHREWNPRTGRHEMVHTTTTKTGVRIRKIFDERLILQQTDLSSESVGAVAERPVTAGARIAFSTRNDGVIDAWATRDAKTQTTRIEVSTQRNGKVDRWEQYVGPQLVRVDLDTNGNGKADRWMIYEGGIQMDTFIDADEDGQPDGPSSR